jgi:hypothetical protein
MPTDVQINPKLVFSSTPTPGYKTSSSHPSVYKRCITQIEGSKPLNRLSTVFSVVFFHSETSACKSNVGRSVYSRGETSRSFYVGLFQPHPNFCETWFCEMPFASAQHGICVPDLAPRLFVRVCYVRIYTTLAIKKVIPCPIVRGSKASILASQELSSQKSESLSGRTT